MTETYMDLRDLEDEVIDLENDYHNLDIEIKVSLSQFHGIELKEYGAMVARTALQIAREQALERSYERFKDSVSAAPHFLPLKDEARGIVCGNALNMDWGDLVTPSNDLFIFGNPPFVGYDFQTQEQKQELQKIFGDSYNGLFDYCAAWYYKAAKFLSGSGACFAFVSPKSVTQEIQVAFPNIKVGGKDEENGPCVVEGLFKPIFDLGWKISFARPSVLWDNDAAVYFVIIGFTENEDKTPRLYSVVEGEEMNWENGTGFGVLELEKL